MAKVVKRTFSLTEEQAAFIDEKVESGGYASGSEVVREGLRGMREGDVVLESWIRREVLPAIQEYDADPSSGISPVQLRRRMKRWFSSSRTAAAK